jgi:predicted transcriptional regulator
MADPCIIEQWVCYISSYPNRNMVKLTEKGRKMGEKISEMLEILNSD